MKKNKIIFGISILILIIFIPLILFLYYYFNTPHMQHKEEVLRLVEKYFNEKEYAPAEILITNLLFKDPQDQEAQAWLNKIVAEKKRQEENSSKIKNEEDINEKLLRIYLNELYAIKASIEKLERELIASCKGYSAQNKETPKLEIKPEKEERMETDVDRFLKNGIAAYNQGNYSEAKDYFLKALAIESKNPSANAFLAASLYEENPQDQESIKKVITYSKKAVEIDKNNKLGYVTLAKAYECTSDKELAVINYLEAVNIDPHDAELFYRIGKLTFEMGETERAEYYLKEALTIKEELPLAYFYLAQIEKKRGNFNRVIDYLKQVLTYNDSFYAAYIDLGECYFARGEYQEAKQNYEKALALKENFFSAYRIGDCLWALHEYDRAETVYWNALEKYRLYTQDEKQKGALLYEKIATKAFERGEYEEVYKLAEKGIELDNQHGALYVLLGKAGRRKQKYTDAITQFKRALAIDDNNTEAYLELLRTYYNAGMRSEAKNTLDQFLIKNPKLEELSEVKEIKRLINEM
jgi:tetratricopeptide (TPR) repeat protein